MKRLLILTLPVIALLSSCSTTPQSRIQKNPEIFLSLNSTQQTKVSEGQIDRGMSQSAVYLAMGQPDSKVTGNRDGRSYTRWDYSVLIPIYSTSYSGYYGGYHGRGRHYGGGYIPTVTYVPTRGSSVYFAKGKVTGWERSRQ